jgi:sulfoxide reductase heme-binding subunit YedZ
MDHAWWLASRAAGVVAVLAVSASVLLGLAMASGTIRRLLPPRVAVAVHEQLALASLVAIGVHGICLLGDPWLHPGLAGIALPFELRYRSAYTGAGIVGGYMSALLGLSFYVRRHIGGGLWRKLHRLTVVAYALIVLHVLGAGTDAGSLWLRVLCLAPAFAAMLAGAVRLSGLRPAGPSARQGGSSARRARPSAGPVPPAAQASRAP